MSNPLLFLLTDIHLTSDNIEETKDLLNQTFAEAQVLDFKTVYVLGDIFDSRKSQTLKVLEAWMSILEMAKSYDIILRVIPGNHDKPSYKSERSYLDIFSMNPSQELVRSYDNFIEGDYMVHMIPFFDEKEIYPEYLKKAVLEIENFKNLKHILLTHIAVNGVKNNDGSKIEEAIGINSFKLFENVFVGHYHDYQVIDNVIYIGAFKQKNFGENNKKGFTIINEDGSWKQIKTLFKEYKTVYLDLNKVTDLEINEQVEKFKDNKDNIRFKFTGTREKIKSLNKSIFEKAGIEIKCEEENPIVNIDYAEIKDFKGFNKETIKSGWIEFVEKNEIVKSINIEGETLLNETLK